MKDTSILIFTLFFLTVCVIASAQDTKKDAPKGNKSGINHRFSVSLGSASTTFQDVKYSTNQYFGYGASLELDYLKIKKNAIWGANFLSLMSFEQPSTFTLDDSNSVLYGKISAKYLWAIATIRDAPLYIGANLDFPEFYFKVVNDLGNNMITLINSTNIKLSSMYSKVLSEQYSLEANLDLQLFSFVKDITSFAFNAPQILLENGQFSYQDKLVILPYSLTAYEFMPLWKYFSINTALRLNYKEKWALSFKWNYRVSARVENYPLHIAYSTLAITYNILNRKK